MPDNELECLQCGQRYAPSAAHRRGSECPACLVPLYLVGGSYEICTPHPCAHLIEAAPAWRADIHVGRDFAWMAIIAAVLYSALASALYWLMR